MPKSTYTAHLSLPPCKRCGKTEHYTWKCDADMGPQRTKLKQRSYSAWTSSLNKDATCNRCEQQGHTAEDCNAEIILCRYCGELGHVRENCPKQKEDEQKALGMASVVGSAADAAASSAAATLPKCGRCGWDGHFEEQCNVILAEDTHPRDKAQKEDVYAYSSLHQSNKKRTASSFNPVLSSIKVKKKKKKKKNKKEKVAEATADETSPIGGSKRSAEDTGASMSGPSLPPTTDEAPAKKIKLTAVVSKKADVTKKKESGDKSSSSNPSLSALMNYDSSDSDDNS